MAHINLFTKGTIQNVHLSHLSAVHQYNLSFHTKEDSISMFFDTLEEVQLYFLQIGDAISGRSIYPPVPSEEAKGDNDGGF